MENLVWTEKYRPKTLDDMIIQESEKNKIRNLIKDPVAMPNFLLVTKSPGTGKTSLAYIIKNELGVHIRDFKTMNSSDERKIEHVRELKDFAMTRSMNGKPKIVHMDEFDGVLSASQDALRNMMEKYNNNCKFILTANDKTKIIAPIIGRCVEINLKEPSKDDICDKMKEICDKESVMNTAEGVLMLVEKYYPNMRSMINTIQELAKVGIVPGTIKTETGMEDRFYELLKTRNVFNIRKYVIENNLDSQAVFKQTLVNLLKDEELEIKYGKENLDPMIRLFSWDAAEFDYRICVGSDKEIQLLAFVFRFLERFK